MAFRIGPDLKQTIANNSVRFGLGRICACARQRFSEIQKRIGSRPKCTEREPSWSLPTQSRNDSGLQQRRLSSARRSQDRERSPVSFGAHFAQLFQHFGNLTTTAVEQRSICIVITERRKAGKRRRPDLAVYRKRFRV